jgi:hypothetical protein
MNQNGGLSLAHRLIWVMFGIATVLATAPVWRLWVFGFDPTLDQLLQMSICGGALK